MRCTGACCHDIRLSHPRDDIRHMRDVKQDPEAALILMLMRPIGDGLHACVALTDDGCALDDMLRPALCRNFPYGGDKWCKACGAQSDAEARGVALQRIT